MVLDHAKLDREYLAPMYKRIYETYKKHDTKVQKIMMFEGAQFPDEVGILGGIVFPVGFPEAPAGKDQLAY
jgi:hypothetical protein